MAMYLVKRYSDRTLPEMAKDFGVGSNSTISWSCRGIEARMVKGKTLRDHIEKIVASINQLNAGPLSAATPDQWYVYFSFLIVFYIVNSSSIGRVVTIDMGLDKLTIKQLSNLLTPRQLIGVLSTLVSLLVGTFSLGSYLAGVRYENQVNEKEKLIQRYSSQWPAIEPHLRMEKFFDISDHVVSVDSREAPPNSILVNKEFLASITIPGLTYAQTTIADYRARFVTEGARFHFRDPPDIKEGDH
ncbi:MAG: hypothetical protein WCH75_07070 [Candidatus Binatia bacterium]